MKITFICNKVTGRGGTETVLVKVLNELKKRNYNIRLILSNLTEDKTWLTKIDSRISYKYPQNDSRLGRLAYFTKVFFNSNENEIFIILSPNLVKYFSTLKKIFHKNIKVVSWIHFSLKHQDFFNPSVLIPADYHLAISSAIKKQLMDMGVPERKIFLIFNPADKHEKIVDKPLDGKKHLLYVGRVQYDGQKNLKEMLNGLKNVSDEIVLDVFGSGKDLEKCQQKCKELGIQNRLNWHGWCNDVWKTINFKPFAIILTSKYEGLPMVFLEALSYGIPCISSNFDGFNDVIDEHKNGFSYCLGNVHELSNTIEKMSGINFDASVVQKSINKFYDDKYYWQLEKVLNIIDSAK